MQTKTSKNILCVLVLISFVAIFVFQILNIGGIFALFLSIIVFSFLLSFCVYKIFIGHLDSLMDGVKNISEGKMNYVIKVDSGGKVGQLASAFNDMTAKLKEARTRNEAMNQMKSEFISIAAHQMRTPATGAKWTLRMLLDGDAGPLTDEQKSMLNRSYQNNERMIKLVNDLLNVSSIEEGRFGYNFTEYYIEEIIDEILNNVADEIKKRQIEVKLEKSKHPARINIDKEKIFLALTNILDNSLKYTSAGGKVEININTLKRKVKINIKDNGIGIPENEQGRIFTKFYRGSNAIKIQTDGSGFGLFIAKNIIEKHGGTIKVESAEEEGTEVFINLPILDLPKK